MAEKQGSSGGGGRWSLEGMTALVTGGTRGIGHAVVEELAGFGAIVHTCSRKEDELNSCLRDWTDKGFRVTGSVCDVSSREGRVKLMETVSTLFNGKLNILINNVGTNVKKPTAEYTAEEYSFLMATNFESSYHLCQLAYSLLKSSEMGSIVFISSVAGVVALNSGSIYAATKGAMNQTTKNLACEWAKDNIRTNCVAPWYIRTSLVEKVAVSCKNRMHHLVKEELEKQDETSGWKNAMERSFSRMDEEVTGMSNGSHSSNCRCKLQTPDINAVGSTAVVSIVTPEKIIVANCGDSRAVLCRGRKAVPLSNDHKPDRPDELQRIQAAGGRVIFWDGPRVLGVLAMSRAIGDNYLKPYVSSEPEVTITDRTENDECLIMASDGLWDVVSNDTACGIARLCLRGQSPALLPVIQTSTVSPGESSDQACLDAALLLTKLALARNSTDNVSVVIVDLRSDT